MGFGVDIYHHSRVAGEEGVGREKDGEDDESKENNRPTPTFESERQQNNDIINEKRKQESQ